MNKLIIFFIQLILFGIYTPTVSATTITSTQDVSLLKDALFGNSLSGIDYDSINISLSGHSCSDCGFLFDSSARSPSTSTGTFSDDNEYGINSGLIISTGGVSESVIEADYPSSYGLTGDGIPATLQQNELLEPISGAKTHFDVTQITINFDMLLGFDSLAFDVVFASDEEPTTSPDLPPFFTDGFGLFINDINIAFVDGQPIFADHENMETTSGTRYESVLGGGVGLLNSIHSFSAPVNATDNKLILILGDALDGEVQSAVFISASSGRRRVVSEPSVFLLFGTGLLGVFLLARHKKNMVIQS